MWRWLEMIMSNNIPRRKEIYFEYCEAKKVINELAFEYLDTDKRWNNQSSEYKALIKSLVAIEAKMEFWDPLEDLPF